MTPYFSIIVPSYNKEQFIAETICSVIAQTYSNFELIIVDDLSTDKSVAIAKSFSEKDTRIQLYVNTENKGGNFSRNFGLQNSKGTYVIFLDADDLLLPNCLESRVDAIEQNSDKNMWVFTMGVFYKTIGDDKRLWLPTTAQPLNDFLSHVLPWQTMQTVWKREFILQLHGFDNDFQRLQDVELHTRALFHPVVNYALYPGKPDCYLRIDEARLNFDVFTFLTKWVNSVILYCEKFYNDAGKRGLSHLLFATVYKTYLQLLFYYKRKKINKQQYHQLRQKLFDYLKKYRLSLSKRILFSLAAPINLSPLRLPGYNWFANRMLIIH